MRPMSRRNLLDALAFRFVPQLDKTRVRQFVNFIIPRASDELDCQRTREILGLLDVQDTFPAFICTAQSLVLDLGEYMPEALFEQVVAHMCRLLQDKRKVGKTKRIYNPAFFFSFLFFEMAAYIYACKTKPFFHTGR